MSRPYYGVQASGRPWPGLVIIRLPLILCSLRGGLSDPPKVRDGRSDLLGHRTLAVLWFGAWRAPGSFVLRHMGTTKRQEAEFLRRGPPWALSDEVGRCIIPSGLWGFTTCYWLSVITERGRPLSAGPTRHHSGGIRTIGQSRRPFRVYLLVFFCVVLGLGGLYGGISFITDPTGGAIGMAVSMLRGFMNTYLPFGIFLLIAFGIAPLVLAWALLARPRWFPGITRATGRDWAWVVMLALGAGLLVWMAGQFIIMGYQAPVQAFTTFLGAVITLLSLVPPVQEYYRVG